VGGATWSIAAVASNQRAAANGQTEWQVRVEMRRPWFPKADTRNTRNQTLAVSPSCDYYI